MKRASFLMLIISLQTTYLSAQDLAQSYDFANVLFAQKEYAEAIETYKRVLFFDQKEEYGTKVYRKMADSFYETKAYKEAAYYYDLAYFSSSKEEQVETTLQKTSCLLMLRQYDLAQIEIFNLPDHLNSEQQELKTFYEAMLAFATGKFEDSELLFKQVSSDTLAVSLLFRENERISKLSPKKARIMSMFLPGLGQVYAGDIKNGINSLLLTGGLFYLGINSALKTSFIDAAISVLPWFQRYYMGGFKKAERIAEAKIKERRYKVFNELLEQVED